MPQRRETTTEGSDQTLKKCIREKKRMKRQQDIQRILEDFKGVRNTLGSKPAKKKLLITKKNEKGECITSRKGIADTFGEFYKRLYEDKERDDFEHEMSDDRRILEITTEVANRNHQTQKKANPRTSKEFEPKTLKLVMKRREKC